MIDALDKQNVKYLCGSAYSSEFLAQLEKQGGCTKVTEAGLASLTGYSASIVSVLRFPGTKLIGVSAKLRPESQDSKPRTGTIYFKRQAGAWKRAVPPKA